MKNGQIPDHWQQWLFVAITALLLAALARQSAIDTVGMSDFNANLIFCGVFVFFGVLFVALHQFFTIHFGEPIVKAFEKVFKWLGLKQGEPQVVEVKSESTTMNQRIETTSEPQSTTTPPQEYSEPSLPEPEKFKLEAPAKSVIHLDYDGIRDSAKNRADEVQREKEEHVILYVGYTFAPLVSKETVEKIINRVTSFIHSNGIAEFTEDETITLPDDITTTDLMHFGWNIAKPFKKYNLHTAHFLKDVFPLTFREAEVCTIERKLKSNALQGKIKINENVATFEIPKEGEEKATEKSSKKSTEKKESKSTSSKKSKKSTSKAKKNRSPRSAMEMAFADMGCDTDIQPYNPGDMVEIPNDGYDDFGW